MNALAEAPRLWMLFILQLFCAFFFLGDAVADLTGWEQTAAAAGIKESDWFEYVVSIALALSAGLTGYEIRQLLLRQKKMSDQIRIASGAFSEILEQHFEDWKLTNSERDVAILAIKGLSIADIASARSTKEGTIKAQCNSIYRKAGVTGRQQLLSLFVGEMFL